MIKVPTKGKKSIWLAAAASLTLVLFSSMLIKVNTELHLREQQWRLLEEEYFNGSANYLFALTKYMNQYELYQNRINHDQHDLKEQQALYMLNMNPQQFASIQANNPLEFVGLHFTNALRKIANRRLLPTDTEKDALTLLDISLRHIMEKNYNEALLMLDNLYKQDLPTLYKGHIRLHVAFCNAMLGNKTNSENIYAQIVAQFGNDRVALNARKLLGELKLFQSLTQDALESQEASLETIRKHALLLDCKGLQAKSIPLENFSQDELSKYWYYKGLCEEESNNTVQAANSYLRSIQLAKDSVAIKNANRRLFLTSQFEPSLTNYKALSEKINQKFADTIFNAMQEIVTEHKLTDLISDNKINKANEQEDVQILKQDSLTKYYNEIVKDATPKVEIQQAIKPVVKEVIKPIVPKIIPKDTVKELEKFAQVEVIMISQRRFSGQLLSHPNDSFIKLKTMVGIITIPRMQISQMYVTD